MSAEELFLLLVFRFEGFVAHPYLCPAGYPTIGLGSRFYEDGTEVKLTDPPISRERAKALALYEYRTKCLPALRRNTPVLGTPGRVAAVADFVYNLGSGRLASSTLRRRINAGDWDSVPREWGKWVMAGGKPLKGLVARREAEISLL